MATRYVNPDADAGGDGTTNGLTGGTCAYQSLSIWEAARQGVLTEVEEVICESVDSADETQLVIDGWTPTAAFYIDIKSGDDDRASTKWDYDKYRIVFGNQNDPNEPIEVREEWVRIDGLQIEVSFGGRTSDAWQQWAIAGAKGDSWDGSQIYISHNHIRFTGAPEVDITSGCHAVLINQGNTTPTTRPLYYIFDNIVSLEITGAFLTPTMNALSPEHRDHTAYIYNNTLVGPWNYAVSAMDAGNNKEHYCENNLIASTVNALVGHTNSYCDYNSTDLADIGYTPNGANDRESQSFSFVKDFIIEAYDTFTVGSDEALEGRTSDGGESWASPDRGFDVIAASDDVGRSVSGGQDSAELEATLDSADYTVSAVVKLGATATTDRVSVLARYDGNGASTQNCYELQITGDGAGNATWYLYEMTDGSGSQLATGSFTTGGGGNYFEIELTVIGTTIIVRLDGKQVAKETDSVHTSALSPGIYMREMNAAMKSFSVKNIPDFALASDDAGAKDYGETDPGSGLFDDDINGDVRSAPWDIGAHEFQAAAGVPPFYHRQHIGFHGG